MLAPAFYWPRLSTRPPACGSKKIGWKALNRFQVGGRRSLGAWLARMGVGLAGHIPSALVAVQSCSGLVSGECLAEVLLRTGLGVVWGSIKFYGFCCFHGLYGVHGSMAFLVSRLLLWFLYGFYMVSLVSWLP